MFEFIALAFSTLIAFILAAIVLLAGVVLGVITEAIRIFHKVAGKSGVFALSLVLCFSFFAMFGVSVLSVVIATVLCFGFHEYANFITRAARAGRYYTEGAAA